jgi:hypothetical protein
MPFSSYATLGEVAKRYAVTCVRGDFVVPLQLPLADYFRAEIDFVQRRVPYKNSEWSICENLIYPILKEVWKSYLDDFDLYGHVTLHFNADLCGEPDYILARKSPLGPEVMDKPYLLVVEAKKDDYERGWGQCLAAMLAAQQLNEFPDQTLFGIATNGRAWEFGKLHARRFTQDLRPFTLTDLDLLFATVNYAFDQCRQQVARLVATS